MTTHDTYSTTPSLSLEIPPADHREKAESILTQFQNGNLTVEDAVVALCDISMDALATVMGCLDTSAEIVSPVAKLSEWEDDLFHRLVHLPGPSSSA